jgi:peptidyl-prolyl cis-trans isomerase SurA
MPRRLPPSPVVLGLLVGLGVLSGTTPARAEVIERVVAVVNDDAVFLSDLRRRAAPFLEQITLNTEPAERKQRVKEMYEHFLRQLVDEQLIEQTARKASITVTSLEVEQAIENVRSQNSLTREQFWAAVKQQGFTEKHYREDVRKQLLRLKVTNQRVRARVNINDDTVKDEYDERVRSARRKQRFHALHVFVPLSATATATEVSQAMKAARELRASVTTDTFEAKMAASSSGGDLGWLDQGDLPEELETALLGLEPGEISEPVRGPSGVHVFLLRERQAGSAAIPEYEAIKDALYRELLDKAMARQQDLFLAELRRAAVIVVTP